MSRISTRSDGRMFFSLDNAHAWRPRLTELAELNLPLKSIADSFGCSYATLANSDHAMEIVRIGWGKYREIIERELFLLATEEADPQADSIERASIRASKTKALQILHKVLHQDPWVPPAETERLSRLSDEELQHELQKHIINPNIKVT